MVQRLLAGALLVAAAVGLAGCLVEASGLRSAGGGGDGDADGDADADAAVDSDSRPDVDDDAGADGDDVDTGCVEGAARCDDDRLNRCVAGRLVYEDLCPLGCDDDLGRCLRLDPSNVPADTLDAATVDVVVALDVMVNTDSCDAAPFALPAPTVETRLMSDGREACVVAASSLVVEDGVTLGAVGYRPLVIVTAGPVTIRGLVDVGGHGQSPGPGGGAAIGGATLPPTCAGAEAPCAEGDDYDGGGGGGGHGVAGGRGGRACGGSGGAAHGVASLEPLAGGCRGAIGQRGAGDGGGPGGAGGGAIQISAAGALVVADSGRVRAGGGGGGAALYGSAGGGGGAGGGVLLELSLIHISEPTRPTT